jgi:hypothetical protein
MKVQRSNDISRTIFINRIVRILMVMILAFVAMMLGSKVVSGKDCSSCQARNMCNGETECIKFSGKNR